MTTLAAPRRSTASHIAEIQLRCGLPQPTAVYGRKRDGPENHGVPGSSPGPATSGFFLFKLQIYVFSDTQSGSYSSLFRSFPAGVALRVAVKNAQYTTLHLCFLCHQYRRHFGLYRRRGVLNPWIYGCRYGVTSCLREGVECVLSNLLCTENVVKRASNF